MRGARVNYEAITSQTTDIDWSRLAAFIDGEGTIYINKQKARKPSWSPRYFLSVVITNTSPLLMAWLSSKFPGSVYHVRGNKYSKKPIMRWQLNDRQGEFVLRKCLPFFVIKRSQAEVGLAFMTLKTENWSRRKVESSTLEIRETMRLQIQGLNTGSALIQ